MSKRDVSQLYLCWTCRGVLFNAVFDIYIDQYVVNQDLTEADIGVLEVPFTDHLPLLGLRVQREDYSLVLSDRSVIPVIFYLDYHHCADYFHICDDDHRDLYYDHLCWSLLVHSCRAPNSPVSVILLMCCAVLFVIVIVVVSCWICIVCLCQESFHLRNTYVDFSLCVHSPVLAAKIISKEVALLLVLIVLDLLQGADYSSSS